MNKGCQYFIIHKPFKVLSQFSDEAGNPGLRSAFPDLPKGIYPVGRLDLDSEGLLLLTDDKGLNHRLLNPKFEHWRTYWVEVDGDVKKETLQKLEKGMEITVNGKTHRTKPAKVSVIQVEIPEREPPVNYKKHPLRSWLQISLSEGKNRQVRKMTAKAGHPTLRLLRVAIEDVRLGDLPAGSFIQLSKSSIYKKLHLS